MTLLLLSPVFAQSVPQSPAEIAISFAPVVKKAVPAVVNIYTKRVVKERVMASPFANDPFFRQFFGNNPALQMQGGVRERVDRSLGSGVIIQADGLIVTAHHVIKDAQQITVVLADRREFPAEVMKRDPQTDLAFLKIKASTPLPFLNLRDSDSLEVGELVLAMGNPFGVGQTVTQGIISALARSGVGASDYQFFIQTDAAINPGNSGGALVDLSGHLIGINTAIYSTSGGSNGIGFAIPANMVKATMGSQVTKEGRVVRPWIGMAGQPVTTEIAESIGLASPRGVLVRKVYEGSPAEKAGLREGDVITAIGGNPIDDDKSLQYRIGTRSVGESVPVQYLRKGESRTASLTLATPPQTKPDTRTLKGKHPLTGLQVATLTPSLALELGMEQAMEQQGVVILGGQNRSGIALQKGDIVVSVNNQDITSAAQLESALEAGKGKWKIVINRGGNALTIQIQG